MARFPSGLTCVFWSITWKQPVGKKSLGNVYLIVNVYNQEAKQLWESRIGNIKSCALPKGLKQCWHVQGPQVLMGGTDAGQGKEQGGGGRGGIRPIVRASVLNGDFISRASECQDREMGEVMETLTTFAWNCLALPPPLFEPSSYGE